MTCRALTGGQGETGRVWVKGWDWDGVKEGKGRREEWRGRGKQRHKGSEEKSFCTEENSYP